MPFSRSCEAKLTLVFCVCSLRGVCSISHETAYGLKTNVIMDSCSNKYLSLYDILGYGGNMGICENMATK